MEEHADHQPKGTKQFAQRRDVPPRLNPLWVYDDEDWAVMRELPTGTLICPEPGCRTQFIRPIENAKGTRFLKDRHRENSCDHHLTRPDLGGGPMSKQHRWLQARIARICASLGLEAIPEHSGTHADVYVPAGPLAIEVQRWSTAFEERTLERRRKGLDVLWLLTDDAHGVGTDRALFQLPAARVRVHEIGHREREAKPWLGETSPRPVRLSVYATVARFDHQSERLVTGYVDAKKFLAEIIDGTRCWYPPGTRGLPRQGGAWVRDEDLQRARVSSRLEPVRVALRAPTPGQFATGMAVRHDSFGDGLVAQVEGSGEKTVVTVDFGAGYGIKRILARYAPLTPTAPVTIGGTAPVPADRAPTSAIDYRHPSEITDDPWVWVDRPNRPDPTEKSGKWMIFAQSWSDLDRDWAVIRDAVLRGELGQAAKAVTAAQGEPRRGGLPIMVYNQDADDADDVRRVLAALRALGFTGRLSYKADAATRNLSYGQGVAIYVSQPGRTDFDDRRPTANGASGVLSTRRPAVQNAPAQDASHPLLEGARLADTIGRLLRALHRAEDPARRAAIRGQLREAHRNLSLLLGPGGNQSQRASTPRD